MEAVLSSVERLGFRLQEVEVDTEHIWRCAMPVIEELDFRPTGHHRGRFDEVEISFTPSRPRSA